MYVQSDILLLTNVFENFRNVCLEIYELDPAKFISALESAWQTSFKKTIVKLDLLEEEYVTLFFDMQKLISNT